MSSFFNFNFAKTKGIFSVTRNITINNENFNLLIPMFENLLAYVNELKSSLLVTKEIFEFNLDSLTSNYVTVNQNLRVKLNPNGSVHMNFIDFKDLSDTIIKFVDINDNHSQLYLDYELFKLDGGDKFDVMEMFIDTAIITDIKIVAF